MNYCEMGHIIPDSALACRVCAAVRSDEALHALQLEYLRKAVAGEFNYTLRIAKGGDRHVVMFTSDARTFCGRELKTKPQIAYEPYSVMTLANVCAGCRVEIRRIVEEVAHAAL